MPSALLYIQRVTQHYTCGFPASGCKCDCTMSLRAHMWSSCLASSMQINYTWTLHGGPVRWWFFRTMTILRDFTAKPTQSPVVFTLWVCTPIHLPLFHPFCSHWTNLPRILLEVASQIVWHIHAIAAWRVMQTLEVWADTKSCRDISRLFKD